MKIELNNVKFGYSPSRFILNDISLTEESNKVIAIVGASGSGKSTLLRLICGIIKKDKRNVLSGSIRIDGYSPVEYTKQGNVSLMFQEPNLLPHLTVRENISFPLRLRKGDLNGTVDTLLNTVNLKEFENYLPSQLSGGMKTRVALARTFSTKPRLLLLDEPFSALDVRWRFILYRELITLQEKYSSTVLIVTHDIQEALLLSNHILVFGQNGSVIKEIQVDKPLPRVFKDNGMKDLEEEYYNIQNLILSS